MTRKKISIRRGAVISFIMLAFLLFSGVLVKVQLIDGAEYAAAATRSTQGSVSIKAARGGIVDRNGKPIVANRQGYSIVFEAASFPSGLKDKNNIIDSLIKVFEKEELEWINNIPIYLDENNNAVFEEEREKDVTQLKSAEMLNLNDYATAQNCLDTFIEEYELSEYSIEEALKIASVHYEMMRTQFQISNPYTFAEDVPSNVVAMVKENSGFYLGVNVEIVPYREYVDGTLAPHILGVVGAISSTEYKEYKDNGYGMNDFIGKNGIELAMEDYLRGTNGKKSVVKDRDGTVSETIIQQPVQGNTVVLTIDTGLQRVAQEALADLVENYVRDTEKKRAAAPAGAVVVSNCKTGEILACASYPTYDISKYYEDFEEISSTEGGPLWNRALRSAYAPGSTMKPSVAIAGLEESAITETTTFHCSNSFRYYDRTFTCVASHRTTRSINVVRALSESCNVFFFETSLKLGATKMNEYRTMLGFGQKTGSELSNEENAGILDSKEYRESLNQTWLPGFTIQSAIGQAGNLCTPIQLNSYVSTIANEGTRYVPHFVKSVLSADYSKVILEKTAEVATETGFSKKTMDLVRTGMLQASSTSYVPRYLGKVAVDVALKTGTSEEDRIYNGKKITINNGFLICFAPYEDSELAISIVCEGFNSGGSTAPIASKIINYYYEDRDSADAPLAENTLLS